MSETLAWILFNVFVVGMLALDLGVVHRHAKTQGLRQALIWSGIWISLAAAFAGILYGTQGRTAALEFSTGYVIELSLSADNLFIFLLIFRYFRLPDEQQYRVLFWGIIGAIIMRAFFIFAGVGLIRRFHWIIYGFGLLLVYSGIRLLFQHGGEVHPEKNPLLRLLRKIMPVTPDYVGSKFFVRGEQLCATPLLLVLIVIETTDVIFAIDSIPAVLSITLNTFIVYTSNIFAILGLRSLFFALSSLMDIFEYLHYGIACVLTFVGAKMMLSHIYPIRTEISLAVIAGILLITIGASAVHREKTV
ncbi:MAG TPA: TerC family protein [Terriglobales bacterium]|jgi:tellurite resistance protein TerC|nr:TerC family protein [Terriglobales bacterium]